jgi:putative peptidoglycan lipid II flippase
MWGLSVDQINAFIDTICASFLLEGSVTALYNSNRLMQFPLALFGIAMSTATLPSLSASAGRQDWGEMKNTLTFSLRIVMFAIFPAMTGLLVLGVPVVELLFEHGRFTHAQTLMTNAALVGFCLGLPAFAASKVLVSSFYSLKDTRTPVRVASGCLAINILGNLLLMERFGVFGLAVSTALASMVNAAVLFWAFRRRMGLMGGRRLFKTLFQSGVCAAVMALAVWGVNQGLSVNLAVRVPSAVMAGADVYMILARFLGMEEFGVLWNAVKGLGRR